MHLFKALFGVDPKIQESKIGFNRRQRVRESERETSCNAKQISISCMRLDVCDWHHSRHRASIRCTAKTIHSNYLIARFNFCVVYFY